MKWNEGGKVYRKRSLGINWIPSTYILLGSLVSGRERTLFKQPENSLSAK